MAGYLAIRPLGLTVQFDWTERELAVRIRSHWPPSALPAPAAQPKAEQALREDLPPALRAMIEETRSDVQQAAVATTSLTPSMVAELEQRARGIGIAMSVIDEGAAVELTVPLTA
jgi:hypothetical protein